MSQHPCPSLSASSQTPLFVLDSVTVTHRDSAGRVSATGLDQVSWTVRQGQHWAVLGHNGAGKSTLLRVILGKTWPDPGNGGVTWHIDGRAETSPIAAAPHMALVSPEVQAEYIRQEWKLNGEELILTGFSGTPLLYGEPTEREKQAMRALVRELSGRLRIRELLPMPVAAMSQGQLRRMLLVRALVSRPRFLVLDEYTDGLDQEARQELYALLRSVSAHATLIIAAHQPDDLPECVTHALLLRDGRVAACGPAREVLAQWRTPAAPGAPGAPNKTGRQRSFGKPVLELEHVDLFLERMQVLKDVTWRVREGENWTVTGENGAGKTSLLRMLWGEEHHAWGGELRWFGKPGPFFMPELRQRLGLVSDRLQAMYRPEMRGEDIVLSGFFGSIGLYDTPTEAMRAAAARWMERLAIARYANQEARHMSYGRLRRFLLCRSLVHSPALLLLDEPCSGLDAASRAAFLETLDQVADSGAQLIYITHRPNEALNCITHTLRLHQGKVVYCGPKERA